MSVSTLITPLKYIYQLFHAIFLALMKTPITLSLSHLLESNRVIYHLKATMSHTSINIQYHLEFMFAKIRPTVTSTLLFCFVYRPPRVGFLQNH